jgi:hypothetical protein
VLQPFVIRLSAVLAALAAVLAFAVPAEAQKRRLAPRLTAVTCVPATASACSKGVRVAIGRQVRLQGRDLAAGMRVTFRWPRGAITTKLKRSRVGWVVRVPAGVRLGEVAVYARRSLRHPRSNQRKIRVVAPAPARRGLPAPAPTAPGTLPAAFRGNGMWIWQLGRAERGDVGAIAARARLAGVSTVYVKAGDGTTRWPQWTSALVQALAAQGIRACAWQFVYGDDPAGEAAVTVDAIRQGAACFVIDAESKYKTRYREAQTYLTAVRDAVGDDFPLGLTTFAYVDYHATFPYSVFLGPRGAQANLPQVYWKDFGDAVDAASAHAFAHNRIYGRPIAPIGQTYQEPAPADMTRFRALWAAYGSAGLSWWSWQHTTPSGWATLNQPAPPPAGVPDPGYPALGRGAKGDEVLWLQQHLRSADPAVQVTGTLDAATDRALRAFQTARGLAVTGTTDPATWEAVLRLGASSVRW